MYDIIPLSVPSIKGNEWLYVKECLDTEWVSSTGKYVDRFEEEICKATGAKYAIACVNGTSALQISLKIVGVEPEDEVIVPTIAFIAPINAVKYISAVPIFMDSDEYYNMSVEKVSDFIENETFYKNGYTFNKKSGRKISAIIPVHVFGNAVRMDELFELCRKYNIKIVEDASESLGTIYTEGDFKGSHTGTIGDIGCLSFNGNKIVTCGGGGMILTNNEKYALYAKYLTTQAKDDEVRYIHHEVGYNFRLTNVQAAIGVAQLEELYNYLKIKEANYLKYKNEIDKIDGLFLNDTPSYARNNKWMYALQIDKEIYGINREEVMSYLAENKIQTRPVWYLNHLQKPYRNFQNYKIEKALQLLDKTLNIPCSVNLTDDQIDFIIDHLKNWKNYIIT